MNGIDWAYETLVNLAVCHSHEHVKARAIQFRKDVLDACVGMACADIDHHVGKKTSYAYHTVLDVCLELTKETV